MRTIIVDDGDAGSVLIMNRIRPDERARVELAAHPLELSVVIGDRRLAARITPATARRLAAVLLELAPARNFTPRLRAGRH